MIEVFTIGFFFVLFLSVVVIVNYVFTKNSFGGGFYHDDFSKRTEK